MSNINKIWGERRRLLLTDKTEIDLLYLRKNTFCSSHKHSQKINKFYVVDGKVRIETEFGHQILTRGMSWEVQPPLMHRFCPLEPSTMIEIAYVTKGKIDANDIDRKSQGGRILYGKEVPFDIMRKNGQLDLRRDGENVE